MFRRPNRPNPPVFIEIDRKMGVQYNGAVIDGAVQARRREDSPSYPAARSGGPGMPGHSGFGAAIIR